MEMYLPKGHKLKGKYEILYCICQSDFSNIYLVEFQRRKYILKECFPKNIVIRLENMEVYTEKNSKKFEIVKKKFFYEVCSLKNLRNSRGIVKIIDNFSENNTEYIVMEKCFGINLKEYILENDRITLEKIIKIFVKILMAVERIHNVDILHLDLKPSNIIIDKYENVKIIDLGSSVKMKYKIEDNKKVYKQKYYSEEIFASSGYSPLEMYSRERKLGRESDIYSLFCILYFMIFKKKMCSSCERFLEDNVNLEEMFRIKWQEQESDEDRSGIDKVKKLDKEYRRKCERLVKIMERGLAMKGEDRYKNIGEIMEKIREIFN